MGLSTGSFIYTISFFVLSVFLVVGLSLSTGNVFVFCWDYKKKFQVFRLGKMRGAFCISLELRKRVDGVVCFAFFLKGISLR